MKLSKRRKEVSYVTQAIKSVRKVFGTFPDAIETMAQRTSLRSGVQEVWHTRKLLFKLNCRYLAYFQPEI